MRLGLLSMLVNTDPKLRMTIYYCYGDDIMKIRYDIGDDYFPDEYLCYASSADIEARAAKEGRKLEIFYEPVFKPEELKLN